MPNILILSGTSEAIELASKLHRFLGSRMRVISSFSGITGNTPEVEGETRVGGFGGIPGLMSYLKDNDIRWLIDATHPFADRISQHAYMATTGTSVARLRLDRPAWKPGQRDRWVSCLDMAGAAEAVRKLNVRRVFLTVGRTELEPFAEIEDVHFLVRQIYPGQTDIPLKDYTVIPGKPPYRLEDEQALLKEHNIQLLVTKNSGGAQTAAKIHAAREARIGMVVVERPPSEPGERVESAADAVEWIQTQLAVAGIQA